MIAKRNSSKSWIAIGLTVGIVAILACALFFLRGRHGPGGGRIDAATILKADRANLTRKDALGAEVYGALIRLAQSGDPEVHRVALERKEDPSPMIRAGVAQALGYFDDDEAFAADKALLSDPELSVRLQAIQGMTHRPSERRKSAVRDMLARSTLTANERAAVASAILALQPTADERDQAIGMLVHMTDETMVKQDPRVAMNAAIALVSAAPTDPRVEAALRSFLQKGTISGVHDIAIRHLASVHDPWLRANFRKLESEPNPGVRLAIIQSMHLACPEDRWQRLESALNQGSGAPPVAPGRPPRTDAVRLAAIQEIGILGGPHAPAFLEKALQGAKFSDQQEIASARRLLNDLQQRPQNYPDRCAGFPVAAVPSPAGS